jgi:hypothetical protein
MYTTYRIKITRRNGDVRYVKQFWPDCTVTSVPSEAREMHSRESAEEWIARDGGDDCAIEAVEHAEASDMSEAASVRHYRTRPIKIRSYEDADGVLLISNHGYQHAYVGQVCGSRVEAYQDTDADYIGAPDNWCELVIEELAHDV